MATKTESLADKLFQELNEYSTKRRRDKTAINKMTETAHELIKTDPCRGNLALGVLATFDRRAEAMHVYHRKALEHGDPTLVYVNYALSLGKLGFFTESVAYAEMAYEADREDLTSLARFITMTLSAGRIKKAFDLLKKWNHVCSDHSCPFTDDIEKGVAIISEAGIDDSDVERVVRTASESFIDHRIYIHEVYFDIAISKNIKRIRMTYELDIPFKELHKIESDIEKRMSAIPKKITRAVVIELTV